MKFFDRYQYEKVYSFFLDALNMFASIVLLALVVAWLFYLPVVGILYLTGIIG